MRVFVTGATGFIGSAIVRELLTAGHEVLGLARSDAAAKSLIAAGAQVHRSNLEDLESLRSGAAMSDGVIHTAFIHDFSKFKASCETDRHAIEALGSALADSDRPLIITSGPALLSPGRLAIEENVPAFGPEGRRLNVPVVAKSPEEAADHFGWFAHFAAIDCPASSQRTRELLGWQPNQPGLIPELDRPRYFET